MTFGQMLASAETAPVQLAAAAAPRGKGHR